MKTKNIQNIIFDLGGVLIDVQQNRTYECFSKITNKTLDIKQLQGKFLKIAFEFEMGKISKKEFKNEFMNFSKISLADEKFDEYFNAMIKSIPVKRINLLKDLGKIYRIFLLSNTNEIHYQYIIEQDFWQPELFEKCYFSHQVGLRKPDKKIFELVINENSLNPYKTLFFDDSPTNIKAARKLGIKSILVKDDICNNF